MPDGSGLFSGLHIGALRRNSTSRQRDNYNAKRQQVDVAAYLTREGATVHGYDEQATSGRDLGKRPQATGMLQDVESGRLDGVAVSELDRLSRDVVGYDAALIADVLGQHRALLITLDRVWRLWRKEDLLQFRIFMGLAGYEVQQTAERFWNGVFQKAKSEPFFMGLPPYGYRTELEASGPIAPGGRTKVKRRPERDEAIAPVFACLATALEECVCLGEVAARLNDGEHWRLGVRGERNGAERRWSITHLRNLLDNPLYGGTWVLGRHSPKKSAIWEAQTAGQRRRPELPTLAVPGLAWFAGEDLKRWREKYRADLARPGKRHRSYERPLRGVLACSGCHRPMVALGAKGYGCPFGNGDIIGRHCERPQTISEEMAFALLPTVLGMALAERADYAATLRGRLGTPGETTALGRKLEEIRSQLNALHAQWYAPGTSYTVPDPVARAMSDLQAEANRLQEGIDREAQRARLTPADETMAARLAADTPAVVAKLPPGAAGALYRKALADVELWRSGWAGNRTYAVAGYTNRLLPR